MTTLEEFWRDNYRRIVRYVTNAYSYFSREDVEEVVSDVIRMHFCDYKARVEAHGAHSAESRMRRWMIRRASFDMLSLIRSRARERDASGQAGQDDGGEDDGAPDEAVFDDPADWLCLRQRLPAVPKILLQYEARGADGAPVDPRLTNKHAMAEKRFLAKLKGRSANESIRSLRA